MPDNLTAPRLLMNKLRHVMAESVETRERLDDVVKLIAASMVADVCSIYVRTHDDQMALIATQGLNSNAVSSMRLKPGEGLVGLVAEKAESIAIEDAPRHPAFSYRPETGEDPFHAFLGVPILKGGRVTGVLTVQNKTERTYGIDEFETLQTIAMVLAEIVHDIELHSGGIGSISFEGRILCEGLGYGRVVLHDPVVPSAKFFGGDVDEEIKRLDDGLAKMHEAIDNMLSIDGAALGTDPREVMETYRLLASDPTWAEKLQDGVRSGLSAEASVDRSRREHRARLDSTQDAYLRERLHDLEDLDNRLLRILGGGARKEVGKHSVLVARHLGPAELLEYRDDNLTAILLEEAAASSHAAIVARALGIPTIGGLPGLTTRIEEGDWIIADAETGHAHIRPDDRLYDAYKSRVSVRSERMAQFNAIRDLPSDTKDGANISLYLNAGLRLDLDHLDEVGAGGVGLFRTEFQFLVSEKLPSLGDQIEFYERVLNTANGRPVVFRTVDLGGDKVMPALNFKREENPALGWRSIRFALDNKGFFKRQLRALVRATGERTLRVMFPMVTTPDEYFEAKAMLEEEVKWSKEQTGIEPEALHVGAMLETPALAFAIPELAGEAKFLSVGTNDLMQFFFAADRMTPKVSDRYDLVSRSAMRFLRKVGDDCRQYGILASVCGESTSKPLEALCLMACGFTNLSMSAAGIGPVKRMIRSVDLEKFKSDFSELLDTSHEPFRNQVLALCDHHGIQL